VLPPNCFVPPGRQNYRLYAIYKIPTLKVLDFQKVKQSERERAQRLATSAAGAAMEADARLEAIAAAATTGAASMDEDGALLAGGAYAAGAMNGENGTNTFEPGEGKSAEESFATQFTVEEKAKIRDMVANAASAEEIDRIESLVKRGIFPGSSSAGSDAMHSQPPTPPPEESYEGNNGKRSAEGDGEGSDAKKQRSE
jgi:U2 small nuclear ribonucleoprotein A'